MFKENGSKQTCSSIQGTQITMESVFISRFTMNNIVPKLQKCWTRKIAFHIISKMLKQPNFSDSQSSTLPKDAPVKFYLSTTFGLSFMISSVAPTRSSTFYAYFGFTHKSETVTLIEFWYHFSEICCRSSCLAHDSELITAWCTYLGPWITCTI